MTPAEGLVCAIIRGDARSLSDDNSLEQLVKVAFHHNLHLILYDIIRKSPAWGRWPPRLREKLKKEAVTAAILDLIGERELRRVLIRLDECGIQPLLLKGVPLAYSLYRSPSLRPRADTDLLIRDSDLRSVARTLMELGYSGPDAQTGNLTSYQCLYRRKDSFGVDHYLDVHWKINDAQLFAKTFTFDELSAEAIKIPALASCARGLGYTHAFLLACMHRFGHAHAPFYVDGKPVYAGDHLRWVYDIHLLCSALNTGEWSEFAALARKKGIAQFCIDGLNAAREAFNAQIPDDTIDSLLTAADNEGASVQKLRTSPAVWFLTNLRALPNLGQRIALTKQVILPPSAYMMEKYQTRNWLALSFLYVCRSVLGIFEWLKRSKR